MKRWQSIILGVVISVATLAYALRGVDLAQLGTTFANGNYLWVIPALALIFLGLYLRAWRWKALLNGRIAVSHSFHILNASYLLNAILPLRLGEVGRAYLATRLDPPIPMFTSLSTVVVERLTDVITVVIFLIVAITLAPVTPEVVMAARISGILAGIGIIVLAIFAARPALAHRILDQLLKIAPFLERLHVRQLADRVLEGIAPIGSLRGALTVTFWTAISWIVSLVVTYIAILIFFERSSWSAALLATSIASLAIALPAVPGSVGPFEAAMILGLNIAGLADPNNPQQQTRAIAFAVLMHIATTGSYAFLGVIGLSQEKISLGELLRSARQMTVRGPITQRTEE